MGQVRLYAAVFHPFSAAQENRWGFAPLSGDVSRTRSLFQFGGQLPAFLLHDGR
nr:MAG TPA: hypothetical protein [Caudoviricetes sp.]